MNEELRMKNDELKAGALSCDGFVSSFFILHSSFPKL